jgi:hypothetical protein
MRFRVAIVWLIIASGLISGQGIGGQAGIGGKAGLGGGAPTSGATSCEGVTGCVLWLQPSGLYCTSALCNTNGQDITAWQDSSGNNNTVTLTTGGTNVTYVTNSLNSLPGLVVAGASCEGVLTSSIAWSTSMTIFVVMSHATISSSNMAFVSGTTNPYFVYRINTSDEQDIVIPGTADLAHGSTTLSASTFYQMNMTYNDSSGAYTFRVAEAADASGTATTHTISSHSTYTFYDNGAEADQFYGTMMEEIIFIPALTTGQVSTVETSLHTKYGI